MQTVEEKVLSRIYGARGGKVVLSSNFFDLGTRDSVAKALSVLTDKGKIQRLAHGIYYLPKKDSILGELLPAPLDIAKAIAASENAKLQPSGAYATNLLGLSEQVPTKVVFLTDGKTRNLKVGATTIQMRHAQPRTLATSGRFSGLVIQALRYITRAYVSEDLLRKLDAVTPAAERPGLLKDLKYAPVWMHPILRTLAEGK